MDQAPTIDLTSASPTLEVATAIALRSLREPLTGLGALLATACAASRAVLAAIYIAPSGSDPVRIIAATGADADGVARIHEHATLMGDSVRDIASSPDGRFAARLDLPEPWTRHAFVTALACTLPEGASVLVVGGDEALDLVPFERISPALSLLACATATRETVATLRRELFALRQERALLAAGLQHDLKTPITSVLGAAALLLDRDGELTTPEREELLDMIQRQGVRMKEMITDTLAAAAEDSHKPARMREISLSDLARRVARVALIARPGDVATEVGSLRFETDPARLERILLNLLDNALKYAPEGTRVHLIVEPSSDQVAITVADLGPGVDPNIVPRLFGAYETDPSRTGGTGLGLHSAAQIASEIGGRISYSRKDRWTRFTLTLPSAPPRETTA